jgi:hypothetical protein
VYELTSQQRGVLFAIRRRIADVIDVLRDKDAD